MKKLEANTEASYLSKEHQLLEPITIKVDGSPKTINVVTIHAMTLSQNVELKPEGDSLSLDEQIMIVAASTGLSSDALESLCLPDWNSVYDPAYEFYAKTSYELASKKLDSSKKTVTLLFSDDREVVLKLPTLRVSKMAEEIKDIAKRTIFLLEQLSDLDEDEILQMPMPDYRALSSVVSDFLLKKAAYFQ
ncbi:phage tail assembly protein [Vibrio lentus]|uniref:phage tail assembly protein n=1 Tax=Vibrio lentus TaxID=136468 RepID=UPI000C82ECBE|nr:phage tail assembly protein [Vibrio lentus]PMI58309.1 hypothetical protein BCU41_04020 [Vibrio lentus]